MSHPLHPSSPRKSRLGNAKLLMLAIAPIVALAVGSAHAASAISWDPGHTGSISDGDGVWDLTTANWGTGAGDITWPNDTSVTFFGAGGAPGTVTITAPNINTGGFTFNSGYTLNANAGSTLTLTDTTPAINVVAGNATVNAPLAGTVGLTVNAAPGTQLTLGGANTYTGGTAINGSVILSTGATLGDPSNALVLGTANTTTAGSLTLSSNLTVGGITSGTLAGDNVVTLNNNATLTDTGAFLLSFTSNVTANNIGSNVSLVVNGQGATVNIAPTNNANFDIGGHNNNGSLAETGNLNLANLTNFIYNTGATGSGSFLVGYGTRSLGLFTGATNNTIVASNVTVGNSGGGDSYNFNQSGTSILSLGNGTNVIDTNEIILGNAKASGSLTFSDPANGTLTIAGQTGGASTADIVISTGSVSTEAGTSTLALAEHSVVVQAGTVTVGNLAGSTAGPVAGVITFDMGTFNAANLIIANNASGSDAAGPNGNVTIGGASPNTTATGVFTVTNSFFLADVTNTSATATANGTLTINGGTLNSFADILRFNNATSGTLNTSTTTLNLNAGVLNLNNHAIGSAAFPITNVNLANTGGFSATLQNLGGTGVNGAGLTANGAGTLILAGVNTYTGGTTVNTLLQVGSPTQSGSLPAGGDVAVNGTLTFAGSGTSSIGNLSGGGTIQQSAGTALVTNAGTNFSGPITINGGTFGGVGTLNSVDLAGGTLQAGASSIDTSGILTVNNLTVDSGTLAFNLGSGSSSMSVGSLTFNSVPTLSFSVIGSVTSGTPYTVLTASSLPAATFAPVDLGRSVITAVEQGNSIVATLTGSGPATLIYTNHSGNGRFDVQTSQNFSNAGSPDYFYQLDNVTFDDSNIGSHSVNIAATVTPSSLTVTTATSYTFAGTGSIAGSTGLTINGGKVVLGNTGTNTYTGTTAINSGTLQVAAPGALPVGGTVSIAGGATLDLDGNAVSLGSLSGTGTISSSSNSAGSSLTYSSLTASTFDGVITDAIGTGNQQTSLTVAGGSLTLTGANTYTGATTINGGSTLQVGNGVSGSISATSAITNFGTLAFNTSNNVTLSSVVGGGTLVQNGISTLTIAGASAFGAIQINAGTLQVGTGGTTGGIGSPAMVDNGALVFNLSSNLTFTGAISGTGTFEQAGTGNLTLTTNSTFAGGVTVSNGTLIVSGTGGYTALGGGDTTVNAGATLVGATSDAFGYFAGSGAPNTLFINGGTVTDLPGATYRVTLPSLVFTGGTLTSAAGANGDSNGQFSLEGSQTTTFAVGPLSITTNAANTTAVISAGKVAIQTPLTFNIAAGSTPSGIDLLITSVLKNYSSTAPAVTVNGPGTLALDANNTFTGGLTVSSGTLQVGTAADTAPLTGPLGDPSGAVTNNSLITFASSQVVTVGNSISGAGAVVVKSGTVLLNGSNSYTGDTTLNGGTLGGTGFISGNVVAGSGPHTIQPGPGGGATGTLSIGGNLTTNANTTLAFDLSSPGGANDLLAVTGNVTLAGGKLAIASQATTGAASLGYYRVLSYSGTLTGSTSGIVLPAIANNLEYTLDTSHDLNAVDVHLGYLGDTNDDGTVDASDLNTVLNHLGVQTSSWAMGNFDGAATIDLNDLNDVLNNLGTSIATSGALLPGSPAATPEPASLALLGLGAAALIARRRKN